MGTSACSRTRLSRRSKLRGKRASPIGLLTVQITHDQIATRSSSLLTITLAVALSSFIAACSPQNANNSTPAVSAVAYGGKEKKQHLYVVYCNGTVDHLDLGKQTKVSSFQLSDKSGNPPLVAKLPTPGMRPDSCLARPFTSKDANPQEAGKAFIIASAQLQRNEVNGHKSYSLLNFSIPAWTLQSQKDLGSFDVLNGTSPSLTRGADGQLKLKNEDPAAELRAELNQYAGDSALTLVTPLAVSANTVLIGYAPSQDAHSAAYALVNRAKRSIVRIEGVPADDPEPALTLAPGGQFVLHSVRAFSPKKNSRQISATGELRLYGADGKLISRRTDERVAGAWYPITMTPKGVAIYTDRHGNYQFVTLGYTFGAEPVLDLSADDMDGTHPGVVYAGE